MAYTDRTALGQWETAYEIGEEVWDILPWGGGPPTVTVPDPSLPTGELTRALETLPDRAAQIADYIHTSKGSLHHEPPSRQALTDPATLAREINTITTWGDDQTLNPQEKRVYDMAQAVIAEARQVQTPVERATGRAEDVAGARVPGWLLPVGIGLALVAPALLDRG